MLRPRQTCLMKLAGSRCAAWQSVATWCCHGCNATIARYVPLACCLCSGRVGNAHKYRDGGLADCSPPFQDAEPSASQRLERSWQAQADSPEPAAHGQAATQPSGKRPRKRKVATSAAAVAAPPAPAAPAETSQAVAADDADRSDRQLLHGSSASGGTSLAMQRAARRHTDQGRVHKRQLARPEQRQVSPRAGPAETFLQSLQDRLYKSRNAK